MTKPKQQRLDLKYVPMKFELNDFEKEMNGITEHLNKHPEDWDKVMGGSYFKGKNDK